MKTWDSVGQCGLLNSVDRVLALSPGSPARLQEVQGAQDDRKGRTEQGNDQVATGSAGPPRGTGEPVDKRQQHLAASEQAQLTKDMLTHMYIDDAAAVSACNTL